MISRGKISGLLDAIHNIVMESKSVGNEVFKAYLRTYKDMVSENMYRSLMKDQVIINYEVYLAGINKKLKYLNFEPWSIYNQISSSLIDIHMPSNSNILIHNICPFMLEIGLTTMGFLSKYIINRFMHKSVKDILASTGVTREKISDLHNITASGIPISIIIPFANVTGNPMKKYFLISRLQADVGLPNSMYNIYDMGYASLNIHVNKYKGDILEVKETEDILYCYRYDIEFNGNRIGLILDSIMNECEYKVISAIDSFLNKNVEMYDYIMEKLLKSTSTSLRNIREVVAKDRYALLKKVETDEESDDTTLI
jgi:hypothetical protein